MFDLFATGAPVKVSWPTSEDAYWLALDRNGNGRIDSGAELFGSVTRLRSGARAAHGYVALRELDDNGDGQLTAADSAFHLIVLWRRPLPDGVAPDEHRRLVDAGISAISLDVLVSPRRDRWGNRFKYRARVTARNGQTLWSYDVFLVTASSAPAHTPVPWNLLSLRN